MKSRGVIRRGSNIRRLPPEVGPVSHRDGCQAGQTGARGADYATV